jgi:hypothetical protein
MQDLHGFSQIIQASVLLRPRGMGLHASPHMNQA